MGKGDIDGRFIIDTDGTSTSRLVELHIYDGIEDADYDDVCSAAATGQTAFDNQMASLFSWYSGQPSTFKSRLRASVNAR